MQIRIFFLLMIYGCFGVCFGQSEQQVDSLNNVVKTTKNDSLKIEALYKLTNYYTMIDMEKAIVLNKKSFAISKNKYREFGLAKSYNIKGIMHDIKGQTDSAYFCYGEALKYATKTKTFSTQASALNNIGLLEWDKSNYIKALQYFDRALRVFEKIDNKSGQANTKSNMGMIHGTLGNLEKERKYHLAALKIRLEIKDIYGISVSYVNLGRHYEIQSMPEKAIVYYRKALDYKKQIDDKRGIAITNNNIASQFIFTKKPDEAIPYLEESVKIANEIKAQPLLIWAYYGLAEAYVLKNQVEKAKKAVETGKDNLASTDDSAGLMTYYLIKEKIALTEKDYKNAYEFAKKKREIEKKISDLDIKKATSEIEAKYESEKKEKELAREKVKVSEKELKIKQKNHLLYIILIIFASFVFIGYLLFNQQKLKNRQLKKESQLKEAMSEIETQNHLQQQRLHISRDLHDNIGAQLTFIISSLDNLKFLELPKEKLHSKINSISNFTIDTIYELRDTIWAMNKSDITLDDLKTRITNFIDNAKSARENIQFEFVIDSNLKEFQTFTSVEGMNIYRIIQEAVNNALKHAKATKISVAINQSKNAIQIVVEDDGGGFDVEAADFSNGLNNMRKRAKELHADIQIVSSDKGTKILLQKPLG